MKITPIEAALSYAAIGWRVLPVRAGAKAPALADWVRFASTDQETIQHWFEVYDDAGVGICTGRESGIFVLDVDVGPGKHGDEGLRDLEVEHGPLPETLTCITGSGGYHYYFLYPEQQEVSNSAKRLPPGLDIRGQGGFVVAPPTRISTLHDQEYAWDGGLDPTALVSPVAPAPAWLLDLLAPPAEAVERTPRDPNLHYACAIDAYDARTTTETVVSMLVADGWTRMRSDGETVHLRRPGKDHGSGSATVGGVAPGVLLSWTSDPGVPFEPEVPYDPHVVLAFTQFGGDRKAADEWLSEQGWGVRSVDIDAEVAAWVASWEDEEVADLLQSSTVELSSVWGLKYDPPKPTIVLRDDGEGLFYPGKVHAVVGEPETGKSWIAQWATASQMMLRGGKTLYWDFESTLEQYLYRLQLYGLEQEHAIGSHYWGAMSVKEPTITALVELIRRDSIGVVVIDSVNRIMGAMGLNYESGPDYVKFTNMCVDPIRAEGVCVILIDHVVKSREQRGRYATGSEQKLGQVDASFHLETISPFAPGTTGVMGIRVAKDRSGGVRSATYGNGTLRRWGLFHLKEEPGGGKEVSIEPWIDPRRAAKDDKAFRKPYPSGLMKAISDVLVEFAVPMPDQAIHAWVEATQKDFSLALNLLVERNVVATDKDGLYFVPNRGYNPTYDPKAPEYDAEAPTPDF